MADHLRRVCRFFTLIALLPLLVAILGSWSGTGELLLFFGIPIVLIALAVNTIRSVYRGTKLPIPAGGWQRRAIATGLPPVLLAITLLAAFPLLSAGIFIGDVTRLMVNSARYEAIIARASKTSASALVARYDGITYAADMGPPIRVAFNVFALRSLFGAIVYDPSGEVMLADGWDDRLQKFRGPDQVTGLFLGGLIGCRHLRGHYYTCWADS